MVSKYSIDGAAGDEYEHNFSVWLTEDCGTCAGKGALVDVENRTFEDCPNPSCVKGQQITMNGQDLIRFIREFGDHPSVDAEL